MTEVQGGLRGKENWDRSSGNKNLFAREHQQTLRVIEDSQYSYLGDVLSCVGSRFARGLS
jgi:hypothetical protein